MTRLAERGAVRRACSTVVPWVLMAATAHAGVRPLVFVGAGFPELAHAEAGILINGRVSVEAKVGVVVFNVQTGVGVTGWFLGTATDRPPTHALLGSVELRLNPTLRPFRLGSGGETIGGSVGTYVGYAFTTRVGFSVRVLLGAIWYGEKSVAVGPNGTLGVGWIF